MGYHLQFASYPYSCKILQLHFTPTTRMHSDAVFSFIDASRMKTVIEVNAHQQIVALYKPFQIRQLDT